MSMITHADGSQAVLNPDGSVYMALPAPVQAAGDLVGWRVREVVYGSHTAECGHGSWTGTWAVTSDDMESERALIRIMSEMRSAYADCVGSHSKIADGIYRWTWSGEADGHRFGHMIIASRITD